MTPDADEDVLVTGFPSPMARRTIARVLAVEPTTRVHALVRGSAEEDLRAFVATLAAGSAPVAERVLAVEGDPSSMDLGLSGAEFRALTARVRRIHHLRDQPEDREESGDRKIAEHAHIDAAREIVEFARECADLRALVFHSTTRVFGTRTGLLREDELDKGQRFASVVDEARARAEKLVRARASELPVIVVRPSIVVGDSVTGEAGRLDGPYLLMLLILTSPPDFALPLPAGGEVPLNLVPIDYVVQAAHAIGRDARAVGRTFHLVDPAPLTARRVFELVAYAGGRRLPKGSIPTNLARALLRTPGLERLARSPRAFIETLLTPTTYDSTNTEQILEGTGIRCPPFEAYVERLVGHVQVRVKEKRAKKAGAGAGFDPDTDVDDPLV